MKNFIVLLFTVALLITFCSHDTWAQNKYKYKNNKQMTRYKGGSVGKLGNSRMYHVFGASINSMSYFGDLSPLSQVASTDVSFTKPGFGLTYGYHFSPWFSFRIGFNYGRLLADDFVSADPTVYESLTRYTRNVHFRNDIKELSMGWELDLIPNFKGPFSRAPMVPFIFVGAAIVHHEPMAIAPDRAPNGNALAEAGQWVKLRPLGTEGQYSDQLDVKPYSNYIFAIPLGVGAKLKLPGNFNAVVEFGYRYVFTDYLDDVSGNYIDLGLLDSDLAKAMSDRSAETVAARLNVDRDMARIAEAGIGSPSSYVSPTDGQTYTVIPGYGNTAQIRGSPSKDVYFVTHLRINYLLSKAGRGPRYR